MKRTSFFLASLTAIALMSCGSENSNSIAEENYSQVQALAKSSPIVVEEADKYPFVNSTQGLVNVNQMSKSSAQSPISKRATGSRSVNCGSMSVSGVPYGYSAVSNWAVCDFTSLPSGSKNISYQWIGSGPSGSGTFGINYAEIVCGNWQYFPFYSFSYANISTNEFRDTDANVLCGVRFYGTCNGTSYGGGNCSLSITNITGYQTYSY